MAACTVHQSGNWLPRANPSARLTLPATVLTLGLFLFVINALMFELADWLLDSFAVSSFAQALL